MTGEDSPRCQTRHKGNYWLLQLQSASAVQEEELGVLNIILYDETVQAVCVCVWKSCSITLHTGGYFYIISDREALPRVQLLAH